MNEEEKQQTEQPQDTCAYRENAKAVLRQRCDRKHRRVEALEVLLKVIPWHILSEQDEELLWHYFVSRD